MRYRVLANFLTALITVCFLTKANAQSGLCPSNLDLEQGNFAGWECRAGSALSFPLPITGPIAGRHTIIDATTAGTDPYGFFPEMCPNGSGYCVKLGNNINGAQAESVSYTYAIPSTAPSFSMLFYYAVVLQNPSGHTASEQPRFRARIIDVTSGLPVPCVDFDFIAGNSTGGFQVSSVDPSVLYKDWTPISINLDAFIGRTIMLEFITQDCTRNGHFGYAYLDVYTVCNGAIQGTTICQGDTSITINAPFGYQTYEWYSDITFTTLISNNQSVTLSPPPAVGSVLPVIVGPFPGFGCYDTLYATITESPKPVSVAGPDQTICNGQLVQIGGPPLPAYTYSWTPAGLVSNPIISNPFAGPVSVPTEFIVTTTDLLTGCFSMDTTVITNVVVDTALTVVGDPDVCAGDPVATLSVNGSSTNVQWHELSTGPIPGATARSYQPTASGVYWASINQQGCPDSTTNYSVFIRPLPIVSFTPSNDSGCVTNNSITFTNNSTAPDNAAMLYLWKFSDGTTDISTDVVKTFTSAGTHNVKLITTSEFGCKDSSNQNIYILMNGTPDFTWDSVCTGVPVRFTNLSRENNSPQAWYRWEFGNGDPPYLVKDPPLVIFNTTPGKFDVLLKMTTLGCENDTQTVVRTIQVNLQEPGHRYRDLTVPQGSSAFIHVRDTIGTLYNWRPPIHLSSYTTPYTEFFAVGNDVRYLIDITDEHTCVTTDTMQVYVLKKPGYYLPTAFTPNNDGLNDVARPYLIGMKGLKSFSVFNRWGQLIFYSQTYGDGWDGKYKGVDQPSGVYVWALEFYDADNKLVKEKGTITIIR